MRQVGTSLGGAGGFGTGHEDLDGSGARSGGQAGVGLRREGRDGAPGRDGRREGAPGRDVASRARSFQDRIDDARRRLGRGAGHDDDHQGEADRAGLEGLPLPPGLGGGAFQAAQQGRGGDSGRTGGDGASGFTPAGDAVPTGREASDDPSGAWPAPVVLSGAEALDAGGPRRLLAAAEPPIDALAALFAAPPSATPAGADAPASDSGAIPSIERRIAGIADRVERAASAERAAGSDAPIALRIPLDGALDGLTSLTVVATAQGFDVTLSRTEGAAPSPELIQAAQGLAERLQRRLGRGGVRIFDGAEPAEEAGGAAPAGTGWAGLSAILGRGTG